MSLVRNRRNLTRLYQRCNAGISWVDVLTSKVLVPAFDEAGFTNCVTQGKVRTNILEADRPRKWEHMCNADTRVRCGWLSSGKVYTEQYRLGRICDENNRCKMGHANVTQHPSVAMHFGQNKKYVARSIPPHNNVRKLARQGWLNIQYSGLVALQ